MRNHHYSKPGYTGRWLVSLFLFLCTAGYGQVVITPNVTGTCHGNDGSVTFSLTGGHTGTHNYSLYTSGSLVGSQTTPTFTGLSTGYYTLRLGGVDSGYLNFNVGYLISSNPTVTNTTCPANQGSIVTAASGGTAPYTYAWSNGAGNVPSISNLSGGRYQLTVTDANSCSAVMDTQIFATSSINVTTNVTGPVCNPTFEAAVSGGTAPYTYSWSNGAQTYNATGLTNNTFYVVTVTDANSCTAIASRYNSYNGLSIDSANGSSVSIISPGCNVGSGSITIHIRTGQAPYTWHWSGTGSTDSIASGLSAGTYSVTVTDANGCTGTRSYYLISANAVYTYVSSAVNPTCGATDGSLTAYAYGGSSPYTYSWSPGGSTTAQLSNLGTGTYTVTVHDNNGCSATATSTLYGQAAYSVHMQSTPTACDTSLYTGTATAIIQGTGGTAPYSFTWYKWYVGSPYVLGSGQSVSGLSYQTSVAVQVLDANGCLPQNNSDSAYIGMDPSCFDHITGYLYNDANGNCVRDAGETAMTGAYIVANGTGVAQYGSPDSTGFYDVYVTPGSYTVRVQLTTGGACLASLCNSSYSHSFTTTGQTSSGNDFGIDLGAQTFDLGVHPGCSASVPGSTKEYWIYYYNYGLVSAPGAVLSFTHDPDLTFVSSTPASTSYDNATHTITWNLGNLSPTVSSWSQVRMLFSTPNTLTLGSYLTCIAQISPTQGDCNPIDNTVSITDEVQGSHDPNEKEVYPSGPLTASDTVLNYTVRFQNDGNAPASLVVIKDTLSANVDPASVVPGASSHPYKFSLSGQGLLTFTFENINLPDSVHDEPHSKGFVNYSVHTKPNLPIGTEVRNTANIYFDFNSAVVTNTTVNTRSDLTGVHDISGNGTMQVSVTPNPVQSQAAVHFTGATGDISFELMDVTGKKVMETTTTRDLTLSGSAFAAGIYTYTARDQAGQMRIGKVAITH